jgi:hypothetical protein
MAIGAKSKVCASVAGTRNVNPKPRWTCCRVFVFLATVFRSSRQCPCLDAGLGMMGARSEFKRVRSLDVTKQAHRLN